MANSLDTPDNNSIETPAVTFTKSDRRNKKKHHNKSSKKARRNFQEAQDNVTKTEEDTPKVDSELAINEPEILESSSMTTESVATSNTEPEAELSDISPIINIDENELTETVEIKKVVKEEVIPKIVFNDEDSTSKLIITQ